MRAFLLAAALSALVPYASQAQTPAWSWVDAHGKHHDGADLRRVLREHVRWVKSAGKGGARADLSHAVLRGANLKGWDLSGASFEGADLTGADLSGSRFGEAPWRPSPPEFIAFHTRPMPGHGQDTYFDLLSYFIQDFRMDAPTAAECSYTPPSIPHVTNMKGATLAGAELNHVLLVGTVFERADLAGAKIDDSDLNQVDLSYADLTKASIVRTGVSAGRFFDAEMAGAILSSSNFSGSDFRFADLRDTRLDGTDFHGAILCNADFEPAVLGADPRLIASARGLPYLTFQNQPDALTTLRNQFRQTGFQLQEKEVTFALKRHDAGVYWGNCSVGSQLACIAFVGNEVLFDWTCQYGLSPGRALVLLFWLCLLCAFGYWLILMFSTSRRTGLYVVPARAGNWPFPHPRLQRIGRGSIRSPVYNHKSSGHGVVAHIKHFLNMLRTWLRFGRRCLWTAIEFSLASAFNLGFREVTAGLWLRLLTRREYEIRARGWARTLSGIQSVCSMALLALWVLTYFGRPFG